MKRNPHLEHLSQTYLFKEINRRKNDFLEKNSEKKLISLGIGDTTEPLPINVTDHIKDMAASLSTLNGYSGYGPEQGLSSLRKAISEKIYNERVKESDVFVSDGAKCDIGRLQTLFGNDIAVAVQDPAYPVYVDGSLIHGVKKLFKMPCTPENDFFPELIPADLIYFASPNNPTGAVASKEQLEELVSFAKQHKAIIIFDSAYSSYIQDSSLPKSIYEIEGAKEVAIEVGSFSKLAGFSGVRLGWTVVPEELTYENGRAIQPDWTRIVTTIFNGASSLSQAGGLSVLHHIDETKKIISFYLENASMLKKALQDRVEVFGGKNAPYLWVRISSKSSWELFQEYLEKYGIVTTPGSGFGPAGEGFLRLSAFGHRKTIEEAILRFSDE